jgi:hypothetical protein
MIILQIDNEDTCRPRDALSRAGIICPSFTCGPHVSMKNIKSAAIICTVYVKGEFVERESQKTAPFSAKDPLMWTVI